MSNRNLILFIIAMISVLFTLIIPSDSYLLKSLFRAICTGTIACYGIFQMKDRYLAIHIFFIIGMIFSIIFDIRYYVPALGYLYSGMVILSALGLYSIGFLTRARANTIQVLSFIPIAFAAYGYIRLLVFLLEKGDVNILIGFYFYFVLVYIVLIAILYWISILTGNRWIIIGTTLFMITDILRSLGITPVHIPLHTEIVLITYLFGQFFIAHSMKDFRKVKPPNVQT